MVLRRLMDFEESVGDVRSQDEFAQYLNRVIALDPPPEVLTLQVHPFDFGAQDYERSRAIFDTLVATDVFRFTAPFAEWSWRMDRDNIGLTKVDVSTYVLDLSAADLDHWISRNPSGSLPTSIDLE